MRIASGFSLGWPPPFAEVRDILGKRRRRKK
jgi:hypothetical protein